MIIPAGSDEDGPCRKVYMKAGRRLEQLKAALSERGELEGSALAVNLGLPGERLYPEFSEAEGSEGYFAIVLVRP